jgi:c-di-GMP-related signal transduction protein
LHGCQIVLFWRFFVEIYIARQPIFDHRQKVYGYELLFRSGLDNVFRHADPDQATSKVIADGFFLLGMRLLTAGARAFINITRDILLKEYVSLMPRDQIVVEVLETIEPDEEVVSACEKLKRDGYLLAVDDFVYDDRYQPLLRSVDFIKVDFLTTPPGERLNLVRRFAPLGIRLLAEKVETQDVFREALEMGYTYFQGYFFSKPVIISGRDIPGFKLHYLKILQEIRRPEMDFRKLGELIKQEVSLSYKLLRYINSSYFGMRNKVHSLPQALILLGETEIKKWISLVAVASMGEDKPEELVVQAVSRARFCEALASAPGFSRRSEDLFFMGMFSLLDAILDRPLPELLEEIPLDADIRDALLGRENALKRILDCVVAYEKGEWERVSEKAGRLGLEESVLSKGYLEALEWTYQCFREQPPPDSR